MPIADFWQYFQELVTEHRGHNHHDGWLPTRDTEVILRSLHQTNHRIAHLMKELDDLKEAVASNTSATQGAGALISQQRGTIDSQAAQIKDLQDQLANSGGGGGGGDGGIVGVDPAELVPLTKQLTDDDNALVDAMAPPAKPTT